MNKEIIMNPDILPTQKEWRLICKMVKQQSELTDEEISEEAKKWGMMGLFSERQFARAILKKAREK
jgi:hypothetical protein